jgi:uncharacterized protein (UPF0276 family)
LRALPLGAVREIHLAGHAERRDAQGHALLIDSHDAPVASEVWSLYETCLALAGPRPTLIEWDSQLPAWQVLRDEAAQAQRRLDAMTALSEAAA